ncbi:MAG: metallophosphoesterase [Bacteroidales bacterium]
MKKIGILSDTHGYLDPKILSFFEPCEEIWHAGDIGNLETFDSLAAFRPLVAVAGNIDDHRVRSACPMVQRFTCEGADVLLTHIGGYPGHYDSRALALIVAKAPTLFVCGHSHILKVIFDKKFQLLHINPGAAGRSGLHSVRTAIRFDLSEGKPSNLQILELARHPNTTTNG